MEIIDLIILVISLVVLYYSISALISLSKLAFILNTRLKEIVDELKRISR